MSEPAYEAQLHSVIECIRQSPPTEISYYAALLVAKIEKEEHPAQYNFLLLTTQKLLEAVSQFYKSTEDDLKDNLKAMVLALNDLFVAAKLRTNFLKIKKNPYWILFRCHLPPFRSYRQYCRFYHRFVFCLHSLG